MDELGRWIIRWALVNDKPERILDILHAKSLTNTDYIQHRKYLTRNAGVIGNKRDIFQSKQTRVILLKIDYGRRTTAQLITYAYTQTCASRLGYVY